MAVLASKDLAAAKKLPSVWLDLMQEIITGLGVQYLTYWASGNGGSPPPRVTNIKNIKMWWLFHFNESTKK